MKDIDFDELDQAVSSVLETPAEPASTTVVAPTVPTPVTEKPKDETVETLEAAPVAETAPESVAEPVLATRKAPLAMKRRGQFMDVMHPSSDMTGKPGEVPVAPVAKVIVEPIVSSVEDEVVTESAKSTGDAVEDEVVTESAKSTGDAVEVVEQPAVTAPVESAEAVESAGVINLWPDPIDAMEKQEEASDSLADDSVAAEDATVEALDATATEATEEAASTSPFLAQAKVDKRPLDAFAGEEAPTDPEVTPQVSGSELPAESQPDVFAVEASPSDKASETTDKDEMPAAVEKQSTPEPGFNASIPQQYVAAENEADDQSLFDTREHHQPLAPTQAKKRGLPGWLVAVIVILLLAGVGVAGGYFWFYYGF